MAEEMTEKEFDRLLAHHYVPIKLGMDEAWELNFLITAFMMTYELQEDAEKDAIREQHNMTMLNELKEKMHYLISSPEYWIHKEPQINIVTLTGSDLLEHLNSIFKETSRQSGESDGG